MPDTNAPAALGRRTGNRAVTEYVATWADEHGAQRVPCTDRDDALAHVLRLRAGGLAAYVETRRCQPWTRIGPVSPDEAISMVTAVAETVGPSPLRVYASSAEGAQAWWDLTDAVDFIRKAHRCTLLDPSTAGHRLAVDSPVSPGYDDLLPGETIQERRRRLPPPDVAPLERIRFEVML